MSDDSQRPIIIKRVKKVVGGGHHGGAWKIAYADFVTAMMAFFLLMWLLGSVNKAKLQGISEYFATPLKVALIGGEGSGNRNNPVDGGGKDVRQQELQVYEKTDQDGTASFQVDEQSARRIEKQRLEDLKQQIEQAIEAMPMLLPFKEQIIIEMTTEGLRIQIADDQNRPSFDSGSARMQPHTAKILRELGQLLNRVPNRISLSGHTDATPYAGGYSGYSNWELSADRANAARRELIAGGIDTEKMLRVVGLGSAVLLKAEDPRDPMNRRISILVMNRRAAEVAAQDGGTLDIGDLEQPTQAKEAASGA